MCSCTFYCDGLIGNEAFEKSGLLLCISNIDINIKLLSGDGSAIAFYRATHAELIVSLTRNNSLFS